MCFGSDSKTVYKDAPPLGSDTKPDGRTTSRREDLLRNQEQSGKTGTAASPSLYNAGGKKQGAVLGASA